MIRPADQSDGAAINRIREQVYAFHAAAVPNRFNPEFSVAMREYLNEFIGGTNQMCFVCEQKQTIVGYLLLNIVTKPGNMVQRARRYLKIEDLGVIEPARRQGVGRALIAQAQSVAREQGVSEIELNVWNFNTAALKFYEHCGFTTYQQQLRLPVD